MTRDEFYYKYGSVKFKFASYYKYTFAYIGLTEDDHTIMVQEGGDSGDIYRSEVYADVEYTINDICPFSGMVKNEKGVIIDEFYDY